jgi:hypothetical protein
VAEVELPNPEHLEHQRSKAFSRRVALTTAFYAVALAVAALGSKVVMKEMLLAQQQASDQWAFYQAKVIREHQYRGQKLMLAAQLAEPSALKGAERAKFEALAKKFADEETRYDAEKKDIQKDARKLEHQRDRHRARDPNFEYAEIFLQIAIVTASVAILAESKAMFAFSLAAAVLGVGLTANGFVFGLPLPFLTTH